MKKVLLACFVLFPFMVSADVSNQCRNSNIVSYTPTTQTTHAEKYVIFYVNKDIKINSLEASFNGESQAVQYKEEGDLIRARVIIPDDLQGDVVTTIGAQSEGGCNPPISFMFIR